MKLKHTLARVTCLSLSITAAIAQNFDSGSDGSDGALVVNATTGDVAIPLPPDGILNYTTIDIAYGTTVTFIPNAGNTPVYMLATDKVNIGGNIDISGKDGIGTSGGQGGPGGYDGGGGTTTLSAGHGQGPGGGMPGAVRDEYSSPGNGEYLSAGYGTSLLMPLVGGSGSGGATDAPYGGGGGGGAILIASNTEINLSDYGSIYAVGGQSARSNNFEPYEAYSYGSGGAVRLVAPRISAHEFSSFSIDVGDLSPGRIRLDFFHSDNLNLLYVYPQESLSAGANMQVFPPNNPQIKIVRIGDNYITDDSSAIHFLPPGTGMVDIEVEVSGFNFGFDLNLVITPENGLPTSLMRPYDPMGTPSVTFTNIIVPTGIPFRVDAWTN